MSSVLRALTLQPISIGEAQRFVTAHHRHHDAPVGGLFAVAVSDGEAVRGVAVIGRPVARMLQDGWTAEVTRVCTLGDKNAPSMLYGAAWRAARALGYRRLITYTLSPSCPDCGAAVPLPTNGFSICPNCDATVIPEGEN